MIPPVNARAVVRPTRVLHVTTAPQMLRTLSGLVRYLKGQGLDVHALASPGELLDQFGAEERIPVHPVAMARRITPLRDLGALWRLARVLRSVRPAIVHGHSPKGGLLSMLAGWACRVPVRVYHIHGLPLMTASGPKRLLLKTAERVSCRLAHQVLCVSASLREVVLAEGLCPPGKVKVLRGGSISGVDADRVFNPALVPPGTREAVRRRYGIPPGAVVAGFIGRIVRDKGLVELAGAWRLLREEFPDLHLLVVGPFEPQDPLPGAVEALLRGDPRIHLAGLNWDLPPLYAALDVCVLPTYREGFGVVLIEAAAMEVPVVATRVPGCVDAVRDRVTGTLAPARDAGALAAALRAYLGDPDLRYRHGRAGRERVLRDFRPEPLWAAVYQEYVKLLEERGLPVPRVEKVADGSAPGGAGPRDSSGLRSHDELATARQARD